MKSFDIPTYYRSSFITAIKEARKENDPRKKDFSPAKLAFGPITFYIARHFGFCYGVENAIEISYKALEENPNKRIFLLSQMIHNQEVNADLQRRGIEFIMDTEGNQFIEWGTLKKDDIVIIPAFGTTLEIEKKLDEIGIEKKRYNTTCPFVEKVWNRSSKLGEEKYTVIIHGKHNHEETRATFSHSKENAPSMVIRDMAEAKLLGDFITGKAPETDFYKLFEGKYSIGFDAKKDLQKVGVVNQTTMLATETQAIAEYLRKIMANKYGTDNIKDHFADTRDTLCYATSDNQGATYGLLKNDADLAIVVGGYNSSNTSHLVELCEEKMPTYYISSAAEIENRKTINHFNYHQKKRITTNNFLPNKVPIEIILTSGASCPDSMVENVMDKLLAYYPESRSKEDVLKEIMQ